MLKLKRISRNKLITKALLFILHIYITYGRKTHPLVSPDHPMTLTFPFYFIQTLIFFSPHLLRVLDKFLSCLSFQSTRHLSIILIFEILINHLLWGVSIINNNIIDVIAILIMPHSSKIIYMQSVKGGRLDH